MFILKSAISLFGRYNQPPPPILIKKNILEQGKALDVVFCSQTFCCWSIFLFIRPGTQQITFENVENVEEYIDGLFEDINIKTLHVLKVEIREMPKHIRDYIEQQLKRRHISYFVTNDYIKPTRMPTFKSIEIIWHGIIVLFNSKHDLLHITFGVNSRLCRTYETIFLALDEIQIETNEDHIKIAEKKSEKYTICFPDEMFPELKFCRLLMTPPNNPWHDFLFRGLYDPRLLCLVWAFASEI